MSAHHEAIGHQLEGWVQGLEPDETVLAGGDIGMLGDWLAVVSMVRVDETGKPVTEYYLCMKDGNMLPHMALGLLRVGESLVNRQTDEQG